MSEKKIELPSRLVNRIIDYLKAHKEDDLWARNILEQLSNYVIFD